MTIFGWDASHYDWERDPTMDMVAARADGITFLTHKIGEGSGYTDPYADEAFARARSAGFEFIGAYYVNHTTDPVGQADRCVALADRLAPWWRTFPGWFWQCDSENWSFDFPPPSAVEAFCDRLAALTGRRVVLYASHGQYGGLLGGIGYPLWNADYVGSAGVHYLEAYPGDSWTPHHGGTPGWSGGWAPYSGQTPALLQYGSTFTIGRQRGCDANAYRGTVEQFRAFITQEDPLMTPTLPDVAKMLAMGYTVDGRDLSRSADLIERDLWNWIHTEGNNIANVRRETAAGLQAVIRAVADLAAHAGVPTDVLARLEAAAAQLAESATAVGTTVEAMPTRDERVAEAFEGAQRAERE